MLLYFLLLSFSTIPVTGQDRYSYRSGDPNGIGKWYMGRQIAHVMSHFGISWLERPEREEEERTSILLKLLEIRPGMAIADIGAGSGYHSIRMARMNPGGRIYAVDVEPEMIAFLDQRIKKEKLNNVSSVLCEEQKVPLPPSSIDIMLLVDVYHEFSYPYEMATSLLKALKPGGRVFLIEFRAEDPEVPIKAVHKMTETQAVREWEAAGFRFVKNIPDLPWQHCLVFTRPK